MASSMEVSAENRGPGRNKRMWSQEEDSMLIEVILDLQNTGRYKADRGFKAGFFSAVERALELKLPGCNIRAKPHIESRLKTLKTHFNIIYDMLYGSTSGFGWDPIKRCVTAEKSVWDEYLKSHKNAAQFVDKPFPFFDDLCIIFGVDRANGKSALGYDEAEEAVNLEEANTENSPETETENEDSMNVSQSPLNKNVAEGTSKRKKIKNDGNISDIVDVIEKSASILGNNIQEATTRLCEAMGETAGHAKRSKINDELQKLSHLSTFDRYRAMRKIGCDDQLVDLFFSVADEEKEEWVRFLLSNA